MGQVIVINCPHRAAAVAQLPQRPRLPYPTLTAEQSARAKARWVRAVRQVTYILKLRRRWARIGHWLQQPWVRAVFEGLVRDRNGQLQWQHQQNRRGPQRPVPKRQLRQRR